MTDAPNHLHVRLDERSKAALRGLLDHTGHKRAHLIRDGLVLLHLTKIGKMPAGETFDVPPKHPRKAPRPLRTRLYQDAYSKFYRRSKQRILARQGSLPTEAQLQRIRSGARRAGEQAVAQYDAEHVKK